MPIDRRHRIQRGVRRRFAFPEPLEQRVLFAAAGDPDATFGAGGSAVIDGSINFALSGGRSRVALQSSGRILVGTPGGDFPNYYAYVLGRKADGSPDTSFGDQGLLQIVVGESATFGELVVQPDDKILMLSTATYNDGDPVLPSGGNIVRVYRFLPDGLPDAGFGGGDGAVDVFGEGAATSFSQAVGMTVLSNGEIIVGCQTGSSEPGSIVLAALKSDGSNDGAFGSQGFADVTDSHGIDDMRAIATGPGNQIVIAGTGSGTPRVLRYSAGGLPDTGFAGGTGEFVIADGQGQSVQALTVQPDGKPVVKIGGGSGAPAPTIFRLTSTGALDQGFSDDGAVTLPLGQSERDGDVAIDSSGGIVVTDTVNNGSGGDDIVVARLTSGGELDKSFGGGDGSVTVNFVPFGEAAGEVTIQPDGKIVASALVRNPQAKDVPALARVLTDAAKPTANITPPIVVSGEAFSDFKVTFTDNVAIDPATIDSDDLEVVHAGNNRLAVTLQNVGSPSGGSVETTWRVAAPGGTWDLADNGTYTINVPAGVSDTSGNTNSSATSPFTVALVGDGPDTAAPVASLNVGPPPSTNDQGYVFTVTYTDNDLVDVESIADNDTVRVSTNDGDFNVIATLSETNVSIDSAVIEATYTIPAPGGVWDAADTDTYFTTTLANSVKDVTGNFVAAKDFGVFLFDGNPGPSPSLNPETPLPSSGAASYDFDVSYEDSVGIAEASLGDNDVTVTGPNGFTQNAKLVNQSGGGSNPNSISATYRFTAPGGTFDKSDNGVYTFTLGSGEVVNVEGAAAPSGTLGTISLNYATLVVGGLDPTFGDGGSGLTGFDPPGPPLKTVDVVTFDDGSAVAAAYTVGNLGDADVTLFRTLEDGSLDPSFGGSNSGLVSLDIGADDRATSIVQLSNGKFLVAGTTSTYDIDGNATDADFFVARFNSDGTVDTTFGGGDGFGIGDFGDGSLERANDLIVLSDGRILVFGQSTFADALGDFAIARFGSDGSFDSTFGTSGRVLTDFNGGADTINSVALSSDGTKVVVGGATASENGVVGSFAFARYNVSDGSIDSSFGQNGATLVDFLGGLDEARSIAILTNGKIIAGGLAASGDPDDPGFSTQFALTRLDSSGVLDTTFGSGGKTLVAFSGPATINQIAIQANGKIVASGQVITSIDTIDTDDIRVAIARFNADGTLDSSFSDDGKIVINFSTDSVEGVNAPLLPAVNAELSDLEAKFEQFRQEVQGLVALTKGGAILALATNNNDVEIARLIGDGGAPSLVVAFVPNISEIDVQSATFVVRYTDDVAVDASLLGTGDIRVTGPNGYNQIAELVSIDSTEDAPEITVRYRIKPTGATFVKGDEGTYSLSVEPNRVADTAGNFLQAAAIPGAEFTVTIPENVTNLRVDGPLTGKFPAAVVGGAKAAGGTVRISNSTNLDVKTVVNVAIFASTDAELDETADTQILVINGVKLAIKPGKSKTLKLKFTQFPSNLADGNYYLIARIDSGNALPELKESDNNAATAAPINIAAPFVDLSGTAGAIKGSLAPGGKISTSALVRNDGNVQAKASVLVNVLASPGNQTVGNGDVVVATPTAKLSLKPATAKASKLNFVLPATGLAPGTYTLLAVLDSGNTLTESNEANNVVVLGEFTI